MERLSQDHLWNKGITFFYKAGENLRDKPSETELDLALLLLATGVELILKQPLLDHDWTLLCRKSVPNEKFETGDFVSIGADEAIKSLKENGLYDASTSFTTALSSLASMRNRLIHFAIRPSREELLAVAAKVMDEILVFQQDLYDGYLDQELRELFLEIDSFVKHRQLQIKASLRAAMRKQSVLRCFYCLKVAVVFDAVRQWTCLFCRADIDFEELQIETNVKSPPSFDRQELDYCRSVDGCCGSFLELGLIKENKCLPRSFVCCSCGQVCNPVKTAPYSGGKVACDSEAKLHPFQEKLSG